MSRIARVILTAIMSVVSTLLILPLAINLATGGDPPKALEPYVNWLWPVIIACLALLTGLQVWEKLRSPRSEFSARHPQHPSNCQLALEQVSHYLDNLQQGSLAERARLSIVLDERPEAVRQPAHLVQRVTGKEFDLSLDQTIAEVFEQMNESMLILGAPGSGKTTQLVELAYRLLSNRKTLAGSIRRRTPRNQQFLSLSTSLIGHSAGDVSEYGPAHRTMPTTVSLILGC